MAKLTISELEKSSIGSVYVINKTSGKNRSDIVFSVPGLHGGQGESILVPSTWIPIELTVFATRQQLLNSVPFRRMIHEGHLELVDDNNASRILSTDEAKEEIDVVRNQQHMAENLSASPEMVVGNDDLQDPARRKAAQAAKNGGNAEASEPDAVIQQLVFRLKGEELTEGQASSQLRTIMNDLTKADIAYMLEQLPRAKFTRVVTLLIEEATRRGMAAEVDAVSGEGE